MELSVGLRWPEFGPIPEKWETRPCSALTERIMVGIVIRPAQYYVKQGVPAFRSANVRESGIDDADLVFISERSNALLAKSQVRAGDVLTVRTGYPGTSAVVPPSFAGANCIDIIISRPLRTVSSDYLAAWINSPFGKSQVLRNQGGLAQQHFNVGDLRNLVVAVPPLPEQQAIAAALRDVNALLRALDRLLAKKRGLKQAAMQQLLTGQTRLPGFSGKWETKLVGGLGPLSKGRGIRKDDVLRDGLPCIRYGEIYTRHSDIIREFYSFISLKVASESRRLQPGEIIFAGSGETAEEIGKCVAFTSDREAYVGGDTILLHPTGHNSTFLAYLLNLPAVAKQKARMGQGDAVVHISSRNLASLVVDVPAPAEQAAIAAVFTDMDAELTALEQRREKTWLLKQGMMQELLTGRKRLV